MKELFYEVIEEARLQKIMIDGEDWPIGFNTIIYDEMGKIKYSGLDDKNLTILVIKDEKEFFEVLNKYLMLEDIFKRKSVNFLDNSDRNRYKLMMAYLFVNATAEDFSEPILYIKRVISYLNDDTFNYFNNGISMKLGDIFYGNILEIKKELQDVRMETPYRMEFKIRNKDNEDEVYDLPSISYGIKGMDSEKECYIYSILDTREDKESKFVKKIKRKLYKVNKEAKKEDNFENGYYDADDLALVTPAAVVSLAIFLTLLKDKDIKLVKGVAFLPVRYLSRNIALDNIVDEEKKKYLFLRNLAIQNNVTDKFLRTFRRITYNMEGVRILTEPYMGDNYMKLEMNCSNNNTNNELLDEVISCCNNKIGRHIK